ncbi:MAG: sialidase family protein [Planctomycetota bacterium]|jgi:sialidase-1
MKSAKQEINIVLAEATEQQPRHQAGTILPFDDGRLLLAYSHFYDKVAKDDGPAHVVGRWSEDEGDSWGAPFELQENIGKLNCMTPSLLRLPSGRILLEFMRKDVQGGGVEGASGVLHPMVKFSDDEGQTWSEPKQITEGNGYWCSCHDRLFLTSKGRVLLPVTTKSDGAHCWFSDDGGETWCKGKGGVMPDDSTKVFVECTIYETKDGRLKRVMRNSSTRFCLGASDDWGDTWTLDYDWGPNVGTSPGMVRRIPDTGDLLLIWNNNQIRTPLCCGISKDDGQTWEKIKDIEPMKRWPAERTHCYPSLTFLNGNAHITYFEGRKHSDPADTVHYGALLSLKYRRLPVEWFYQE